MFLAESDCTGNGNLIQEHKLVGFPHWVRARGPISLCKAFVQQKIGKARLWILGVKAEMGTQPGDAMSDRK